MSQQKQSSHTRSFLESWPLCFPLATTSTCSTNVTLPCPRSDLAVITIPTSLAVRLLWDNLEKWLSARWRSSVKTKRPDSGCWLLFAVDFNPVSQIETFYTTVKGAIRLRVLPCEVVIIRLAISSVTKCLGVGCSRSFSLSFFQRDSERSNCNISVHQRW